MREQGQSTVLVIFPGAMMPVRGGGVQRAWAMVNSLRHMGYRVELATTGYVDQADEAQAEKRVDKLWVQRRAIQRPAPKQASPGSAPKAPSKTIVWKDSLKRLLARLTKMEPETEPPSSEVKSIFAEKRIRSLEDVAQRAAYSSRPIAAIAHYGWIANTLDRMPPDTLRILDTIDIQHTRRDNAEKAGGDLSHIVCTREEEIAELERADVLLAIQQEELEELKEMCPDRESILVEHGHTVPDYVASPEDSLDVLYVGNLYDPNVIGLRQYFDTTWPEVLEAAPSCRMSVCGRICEAFSEPIPGVTFEGVVEDLAEYYLRAAVVVNPVVYGSGLKIKSVEAMANGRCLVCTKAGTQGLGDPSELPAVVTENAASMAAEIVRLVTDTKCRWELEQRTHDFARQHYSHDFVYRDLEALLERHLSNHLLPLPTNP